jgi:NAD(P)-dependent dehydrogenase (short-subunit alcohol dehydrogenase family)
MVVATDRSMSGKVCLVTGATSGIGAVTAEELARRGATVCIVGRDLGKCQAAVEQIRRDTGNPSVEFLRGDLSSQAEIRRLADEFRGRHSRLDVLVNNAGGMFLRRQESVDGIERTFALNHLAYFLLTNLLLDLLKAAAPARVVCVSSDSHKWPRRIDLDDYQGRKRYGGLRAYGQSKLANVLFTFELARRLEGTGVTANALHPGFVATPFFASSGMLGVPGRLMGIGARLFAISPEEGARTSIYLACAPEVEGVTGRYFYRCKAIAASSAARNPEAGRRLWELSEEITRPTARVG